LSGSDRHYRRSRTAFGNGWPEPVKSILVPTETGDSRGSFKGLDGWGRPRLDRWRRCRCLNGRRRYRRLNGLRRRACRWCRSILDDLRVCGARSRCAGFHPRLAVAPAGSSQSPGTSNGWSSRISNQCARNRPYRAEHHCSRQGSKGSVTAAFLGQCSRRNKRQRYHRCNNKPFHMCFPEAPRCSGYDRIAAVRRRPSAATACGIGSRAVGASGGEVPLRIDI
jgi:hypothetical protein